MLIKILRIVAIMIGIPLLAVKACQFAMDTRAQQPSFADFPSDHVFTVRIAGQTLSFSHEDNPGIKLTSLELPHADGIIYAQHVSLNISTDHVEADSIRAGPFSLSGGCGMRRAQFSPSEQAALEAAAITDNYIILSQNGPRERQSRRVYFPDSSFLGEPIVLRQVTVVNIYGDYFWKTDFDQTVAECAHLRIGLGIDDGHTNEVPAVLANIERQMEDILTSAEPD